MEGWESTRIALKHSVSSFAVNDIVYKNGAVTSLSRLFHPSRKYTVGSGRYTCGLAMLDMV
jgi:hypothetical protein